MFKKAKPLKEPESFEHGYNYALFLLGLRLRTEGELRKKMRERGYAGSVTDQVVRQLTDERLLNDPQYAEIFIDNMRQYKTYGFFMMKKKLMEKLLPQALIEQKLKDLLSLDQEEQIASRILKKEQTATISQESKQKLAQKLRARGFRNDVITRVLFSS